MALLLLNFYTHTLDKTIKGFFNLNPHAMSLNTLSIATATKSLILPLNVVTDVTRPKQLNYVMTRVEC